MQPSTLIKKILWTANNLSHICVYKSNKKGNYIMPVATFDRDLKRLVPVGNLYLVAGENIPDIP